MFRKSGKCKAGRLEFATIFIKSSILHKIKACTNIGKIDYKSFIYIINKNFNAKVSSWIQLNCQMISYYLLKGVHKKTFTNVNTAFNVLFRGQDGIFFIKIFVYYIYEWFIINFAYICLDFMENWKFKKDSSKIQPARSALAWFPQHFLLLFVKFKSMDLGRYFFYLKFC